MSRDPGLASVLEQDADPEEKQAVRRTQRRVRTLLGVALVVYVAFVAWVFTSGWFRVMQSTPIQPEALALYLALLVLAAAPLALRFLYSRHLVQSLTRMARALRSARDQAREGSRAKADFLATMSHEIRTPMNAVIGFAELLGKTPLDPAQTEYVGAIRESGTHLLSVINDVLDYSKIEAGRIELDEKAFEVVPLVESCVKALSLAADQKGIELGFLRQDGTPQALFGDAPRLRQVLLNLLSNAVKFTEKGEIVVGLAATLEKDGRHLIRFEVRDTGVGIDPAEMPRLFQAFTQADSSSTRRQDGTGLGLAISRRLCELMGGTLTVESERGKGSVFTATIRAAPAPVPPRLRQKVPEAFRGVRLLVVDDNAMNRTILSRNAQSWGMRVRATGDPFEALDWMKAGDPFDLAILDHRMPGMDGIALGQRMAVLAGRSAPPVLLATSARDLPDVGPGTPFRGRIRKPFLASELLEALRTTLLDSRGRVRSRPPATVKERQQPTTPAGTPSPLRVLLVEDNLMNRRLALKVLESLGHRADVAENGAEALQAVTRRHYDVVLMDVQMPVMDGYEATRELRRREGDDLHTPVIAMTAYSLRGDRERCLAAGMDDYISKPVRLEVLSSILARQEAA
ncbi:MAG: response regulator [Thermoplasmatota archaeon]